MFRARFPKIRAQFDLENMAREARGEIPFQVTRMLIAQDQANVVRNHDADVVATYQPGFPG